MIAPSKESKFVELLAVKVAGGSSIKKAAMDIGCSNQTAYNISNTAEFRSRVSEIRSQSISDAVGGLTIAASQAVDTLTQLLREGNPPVIRLNASKAILASLAPLSELGELRSRIDKIEAAQATPR